MTQNPWNREDCLDRSSAFLLKTLLPKGSSQEKELPKLNTYENPFAKYQKANHFL